MPLTRAAGMDAASAASPALYPPCPPLGVAIVGAGSAAVRGHLPALRVASSAGKATVVGVTDINQQRAAALVAELPSATCFPTLDAMLEAVRPQLLVVATPPSAHLPAIRTALASGVDVLCEKPLGLTDAESGELDALLRAHPGALVATVLQYRCARAWQRFAGGAAEARSASERWRLSVEVERPGTDPLSAGGWREDADGEGGILGDHAVHHLGLCWDLDHAFEVTDCRTADGGDTATVRLEGKTATAEIRATYRGRRRRNLVVLERPEVGVSVRWEGDRVQVSGSGGIRPGKPAEDLSDRSTVNALYAELYRELLAWMGTPWWRAEQTAETAGVAALLAACARISQSPPGRVP